MIHRKNELQASTAGRNEALAVERDIELSRLGFRRTTKRAHEAIFLPVVYSDRDYGRRRYFADHAVTLIDPAGRPCLLVEPYGFGVDDMRDIVGLADEFGYEVSVNQRYACWNPPKTTAVLFHAPADVRPFSRRMRDNYQSTLESGRRIYLEREGDTWRRITKGQLISALSAHFPTSEISRFIRHLSK